MTFSRILTTGLLLSLVGILLAVSSQSQKPKSVTPPGLVVINKTKSLTVISTVRNGDELYIAFRNDHTKTILAYAISIGNTRVTEDFAYSGFAQAGIPPGTTHERRIHFSESTEPINIDAVFLDGGIAEGKSAVVERIKDDRLGARIQIERTLKVLEKFLDPSHPKKNAEVHSLKAEIVSLLNAPETDSLAALKRLQPTRSWHSLSDQAKNALEDGKQSVLSEFRAVEAADDPTEAMINLKQHYEKVLRRF